MADTPTNWLGVITVIVANLAGILMALATLIAVIKGGFNVLTEKVDGWKKETLESLKKSHEAKGMVDALIQNPPIKTEVIMDRRSEER